MRLSKRQALVGGCVLSMVSVFFLAGRLAGQSSKTRTDLPARLEREVPRLMEKAGIPGLSLAVIRAGKIFWTGYFGVRSRTIGDRVRENTMFEAASITKTVTAYAAMRLVEQGRLDLDRPLHEYFPGKEYPDLASDPRYKKITARLVLTHTTGLPNWGSKLVWEPGKRYGYSGEGFHYLGQAIEVISGLSLQDFADKEIFKPLGMGQTTYVWNEAYAAVGASGHDHQGKDNGLRKNTEASGGASLLTTARDYAAFLCALLNDRGLKKETIAAMISPQVRATKRGPGETPLDDHVSWGLGWGIQPAADGYGFWHWGDNYDLRSYTVAYKQRKEGLVYFTNSENGLAVAQALAALVFEDHQYSLDWLDYEPYDNPKRIAKFSVEKAFIEEGIDSGLQKLQQIRIGSPDSLGEEALIDVARYLNATGQKKASTAVYQACLESYPASAGVHYWLAVARLESGQYREAREGFQGALKVRADYPDARRGLEWADDMLRVEKDPVAFSAKEMEKFAGDYGARMVVFRDGRLIYQREGRPEFLLMPISRDTFVLEGNASFRIRFISDEKGETIKLVGLYLDGRSDESLRTSAAGREAGLAGIKDISCQQALEIIGQHRQDQNFVIIDFRTEEMFAQSHIRGAICHDVFSKDIDDWLKTLDRDKNYLIYCTIGHRSGIALSKMKDMGFINILHLNEGLIRWNQMGYETVSGSDLDLSK